MLTDTAKMLLEVKAEKKEMELDFTAMALKWGGGSHDSARECATLRLADQRGD